MWFYDEQQISAVFGSDKKICKLQIYGVLAILSYNTSWRIGWPLYKAHQLGNIWNTESCNAAEINLPTENWVKTKQGLTYGVSREHCIVNSRQHVQCSIDWLPFHLQKTQFKPESRKFVINSSCCECIKNIYSSFCFLNISSSDELFVNIYWKV